mgnify:CR=1 FL=1
MIQVIPAIDLIDGKVQRLQQGDFNRKTPYPWDPVELSLLLDQKGFKRLHLVDLEGAGEQRPVHLEVLQAIGRETSLAIDYGGGIRRGEDVERVLEAGARFVAVGSLAVNEPDRLKSWMDAFGGRSFLVAADVRQGRVTTSAWRQNSALRVEQVVDPLLPHGLEQLLCTDISRDGMLEGIRRGFYEDLRKRLPSLHIIASGGITSPNDLKRLEKAGIDAAVVGKAMYENPFDMDRLAAYAG